MIEEKEKKSRFRRKKKKDDEMLRIEELEKLMADTGGEVDPDTLISMYMPQLKRKLFAAALLRNLTDSNTIVCLGALIAAVIVYAIFVVVLRCITYEDCMLLPKGEKIAKILHIKQKT